MSGREIIGDAIRAARPGWNVIDTARKIDSSSRPAAIVWPTTLTRVEQHGVNWLQTSCEVWIIAPAPTPATVLETALETLLIELLDILEAHPEIAWESAERGVLDEAFHGWKVTANTVHQIERN